MTSASLSSSMEDEAGETQLLLQSPNASGDLSGSGLSHYSTASRIRQSMRDEKRMLEEQKRGKIFAGCFAGLVGFAWILFMGTAYMKLGLEKKNGS